jgi:hypothetical protein
VRGALFRSIATFSINKRNITINRLLSIIGTVSIVNVSSLWSIIFDSKIPLILLLKSRTKNLDILNSVLEIECEQRN